MILEKNSLLSGSFFILILIPFGIGCFLIEKAFSYQYFNIPLLIMGMIGFCASIWSAFYLIQSFPFVKIENNNLIIKYLLKREQQFDLQKLIAIKSKFQKEKDENTSFEFSFKNNETITLNLSHYFNHKEFITLLGNFKEVEYIKEVENNTKELSILIIVISTVMFFITSIQVYEAFFREVNSTNLTEIPITIKRPFNVKKIGGKHTNYKVNFGIQEFDNYYFNFTDALYYDLLEQSNITMLKPGETLYISILKDDFNKFLLKNKEFSFFEKHFDRNSFDIFAIKNYYTISDFNKHKKKGVKNAFIILLIFFPIFMYAYKNSKKSL